MRLEYANCLGKAMKIIIRGRNNKITRREVNLASKWMCRFLLGEDSKPLKIKIVFRIPENRKECGSVYFPRSHYRFPKSFFIDINPRLSRRMQLITLAHELVHVKQYVLGELRDTKYEKWVRWKNKKIAFFNSAGFTYKNAPWEIEAHGKEYKIYRKYCDYLIENNIIFRKS